MNSKDKRAELKKVMGVSISFMTAALLFSSVCSGDKVERNILWAKSVEVHKETMVDAVSDPVPLAVETPEKVHSGFIFDRNKMSDNYIIIPKQDNENGLATLTDEYVYRTIYIDIANKNDGFYDVSSVIRYAKNKKIVGEPKDLVLPPYLEAFIAGKSDASEIDMEAYESIETGKKKQKKNDDPIVNIRLIKLDGVQSVIRFAITFDRLYVPELFEDETNYYISLRKPKDVYKKILVVDIGHGGRDAGTFSGDSKVLEKDTVLDFGFKLKYYFDRQDDIKVYYTRLNDVYLYRRPRADLANELEADFFLSIHNNNYTVLGTPIDFNKVRGTEIHYNEKIKNTKVSSERFATLILDNICSVIDTKKRGAVRGSELYVLGHTNMPSALVEIGFLTNKEDLALIQDDKKMKQCAEAAYEAIVQAFKENEE